ncbi:MAG: MarR family transcriptional regulator [Acholeplasmataceae bacterium]|nr:MarR family transcriptional regulator [Acholeplasmataceae bacterium]
MEWKLNDQLCFLLYANSRNVIKLYKELLNPLGLTYTQYITMIALWEEDHQMVSDLGTRLSLDSGTLTPLLKKLEQEGRIKRTRDLKDERKVWIDLTQAGKKLSDEAKHVPFELFKCVDLDIEDAKKLYEILSKLHNKNNSCEKLDEQGA